MNTATNLEDARIVLDGIGKSYGSTVALEGMDLSIGKATTHAICGFQNYRTAITLNPGQPFQ